MGKPGQLSAEAIKNTGKGGNDENSHAQEYGDGYKKHRHGIAHGTFDLILKFGIVLQQLGKPFEGFIEHPAGFPSFHHGDGELVKNLGPTS